MAGLSFSKMPDSKCTDFQFRKAPPDECDGKNHTSTLLLGHDDCLNKMQLDADVPFFLRKRYYVIAFIFVGYVFNILLGVNLSICIVDVTSDKTETVGNVTRIIRRAELNMTSTEIGLLLSAMSWGFVASPLGGVLAIKFGGVNVYGLGLLATGLLTIVTPVLLRWSVVAYLLCRLLEGLFEGLVNSSVTEIYVQWIPPRERSRLMAVASSGFQAGFIISYPICGYMAYRYNWEFVFYMTGVATLVFCAAWFIFVKNTPETDKIILQKEKKYLEFVNKRDTENKKTIYPWKQILCSKSVWAYLIGRFIEAWVLTFVMSCLPLYLKDVSTDWNIQDIGILSGIPHFLGLSGLLLAGFVSDHLRSNKIMTVTNGHKTFVTITQLMTTVLLFTAGQWENMVVCSVCLCLYRFFSSFEYLSFNVLPVDMAAKYASLIAGLGFATMALGMILSPITMGLIVTNHSISQWNTYFVLLSVLNVFGGISFLAFGSGELQPWATSTKTGMV